MTAHNHMPGKNDDQAYGAGSGPDQSPRGLPADATRAVGARVGPLAMTQRKGSPQ